MKITYFLEISQPDNVSAQLFALLCGELQKLSRNICQCDYHSLLTSHYWLFLFFNAIFFGGTAPLGIYWHPR